MKDLKRLGRSLLLVAPALVSQVPTMPQEAKDTPPLACNRGAVTGEDRKRHDALTRQLRAAVAGIRELADGYALRLEGMPLAAVAEWVSLERRCCSFFDFRIDVPRGESPAWLRLTGPDGVKEFLRANFALAPQGAGRAPR